MSAPRGISLRTQIRLILLGTAIVPLGIVGLWMTRSAMRSGEDLLRSHLDASADGFVSAIERRWEYRSADIGMIAANDATVHAVTSPTLSADDQRYLDALATEVARSIPAIELRDAQGRVRWSTTPQSRAVHAPPNDRLRDEAAGNAPLFRVQTRIIDPAGRRVGTAGTDVVIPSLIPADSTRLLVPGARFGVRGAATGVVFVPLDARVAFPSTSPVVLNGDPWLAVRRRLTQPPIELVIAAPLAPYVAPFRHAAAIGAIALLIVAALAALFATMLASRATRPLEQLALASDAVTDGEMNQRVEVAGPTEVRRVAAGFNVMTENLRATMDALSRRSAMAAVGEFATSLSHDVRNALTSVRVDLDRVAIRDIGDPVAATLVRRALNSVSRLESAVTGALRVARRGQTPIHDVDLRAPIHAAAEAVRGTIAALPGELELHLPLTPLRIRGDAAALEQLFANLLFNAAQAMSAGSIVRVSAEHLDGEARITIVDTGAGISESNLAKLETPFFSTKTAGTGLGLPIARQIVAAHGGSLTIESTEGQGTTVCVRLSVEMNRSRDLNASSRATTSVG